MPPVRPVLALGVLLTLFVGWGAVFANDALTRSLAVLSRPLETTGDLEPLIQAAADSRLVLLGEASHGTHEFYLWRDHISRHLIEGSGYDFVVIEGDWAELVPLDRYVRHQAHAPRSAREALAQVDRWPRWVWANKELAAFAEWLRLFNADRSPGERVGVHGMDLYAVWESLDALKDFFDTCRPDAATTLTQLHRLLQPFRGDPRAYGGAIQGRPDLVGPAILQVLRDITSGDRGAGPGCREQVFEMPQHARVVAAGERYLRLLHAPPAWSWNVRTRHFDATVTRLLHRYGPDSRGIVWAHNTHVGDAQATGMAFSGEHSLGELSRRRHGADAVYIVGFGSGEGELLAARAWDGPRETLPLPPPRPDSLEAAMLASATGDRLILLDGANPATHPLRRWIPHRAVGVVYDPDRERTQNYVPTRLLRRYDAFVFVSRSRPLETLDGSARQQTDVRAVSDRDNSASSREIP